MAHMSAFTWLNLLPLEISTRIAMFTSRGARNDDLFHLGNLGPPLNEAAYASLQNTLTMFPNVQKNILWTSICPLSITVVDFQSGNVDEIVIPTLLSKLDITVINVRRRADEGIYNCIRACRASLRELSISFGEEDAWDEFWNTMEVLDLERLKLMCECGAFSVDQEEYDINTCAYRDEEYFNNSYNALAKCCANLRELEVSDCCVNSLPMDEDDTSGMPIIRGLTKLQRITFQGQCYPLIRDLLEVMETPAKCWFKLDNVSNVDDTLSFGWSLLHLEMGQPFSKSQVAALGACTNLEKLNIRLVDGSEEELVRVVPSMPMLNWLQLCWGEGGGFGNDMDYHAVRPGALLTIVQSAPKLKALGLGKVKLRREEQEAMLRTAGSTLEQFHVCVQHQDECALKRWERIAISIAKYNLNLRSLRVLDVDMAMRGKAPIKRAMNFMHDRCVRGTRMEEMMGNLEQFLQVLVNAGLELEVMEVG